MQFLLLLYEDESVYGPNKNGPVVKEMLPRHIAFREDVGAARLGSAALECEATTTSVRIGPGGAKTVHDGPFAESKEQLGGFYLIEAPDHAAAVAIAKKVPVYREGWVEVRRIWSPS